MSVGDGRLGYPEGAPYDAIHVGAAAPTLPKAVSTRVPAHHYTETGLSAWITNNS